MNNYFKLNFFFFPRVPEVVALKKHVLVMSFIGSEGRPAPKLKEAVEHMSQAEVARAYQQVEEMIGQGQQAPGPLQPQGPEAGQLEGGQAQGGQLQRR